MNNFRKFSTVFAGPIVVSSIVGGLVWFYNGEKVDALVVGLLVNLTLIIAMDYHRHIEKISDFLSVHSRILDSEELKEFAAAAKCASEGESELQRDLTSNSLKIWAEQLTGLGNGRWHADSMEAFVDLAMILFGRTYCRKTYYGTTIAGDYENYWLSPHGTRYQHKTSEAIERGVEVIRLFVLPTIADLPLSSPIMEAHHKLGIKVYFVCRDQIGGRIPIRDFGIWDRKVAALLTDPQHKGAEFRATFHFNGNEIKKACDNFDALLSVSKRFYSSPLPPVENQPNVDPSQNS